MPEPQVFDPLTDEDALSVLAFQLRANPKPLRETILIEWVMGALSREFEPCETCAGKLSEWRLRCQRTAKVIGASFNEWDEKWIS